MHAVTDELLTQMVDRLVEALHPVQIYLFGSQASGKTHKHSDVDLMVVVADDAPDSFELARLGYPALANLRVPVELHFVRKSDLAKWTPVRFSLPYEATRKGKLIYAAGPASHPAVA
jgi:predicted nucleotidyltransferase